MNTDPDYSAAYVALETDDPSGLAGHGLTFTIGRGTEVCVAAIDALAPHVVGATVEELVADLGGFWRRLVTDSQLRWLGPEKGVIHLATAAIVNAVWDLYAKLEGKPLWKLLADMTPGAARGVHRLSLHRRCAHAGRGARHPASRNESTKAERELTLLAEGFPAYTTSAGWLGYSEETLPERARDALADGFTHLKLKVGGDLESDLRRARIVRDAIGPEHRLSLDANQAWGVDAGDRRDRDARRKSIRGGSRSRRARTTFSATSASATRSRRFGSRPASTSRTASSSSSCCRPARSTSASSTAVGSAASTRCWQSSCSRRSSACRSARTPAASGCASTRSTCRCSTTSPSSGTFDDRVCEFVDHLHEHFVDPVRVVARSLSRADDAGLQHRDPAGVAVRVRVSGRSGLVEGGGSPRMSIGRH